MKSIDIPIGSHFWALMDNKLVIIIKCGDGYYVCGGWECNINFKYFKFIEYISVPMGYKEKELYYE